MSEVLVLTKKGTFLKTQTKETVAEIWEQMMGKNPNRDFSREWLILTKTNGKPYIINKRFIFKVEE